MPIRKINDIKANKGTIGTYTGFLAGDLLHFIAELKAMKRSNVTPIVENVRWNLVVIVSIFESFYKELFAKYIDFGAPYIDNAAKLSTDKRHISTDSLISLSKETFSIGDIFAYSLKYNSFSEIRKNYEVICKCDYVDKLITYPFNLAGTDAEEAERAQQNAKDIFSKLEQVFLLRHSLIHEYPANNVMTGVDQMLEYLDSGWLLLMATDRMFWEDTGLRKPF
jgi:hypothetical protein